MVKTCKMFESSAGNLFHEARDAHLDELRFWLRSNGLDNECFTNKIVDAVSDRPHDLKDVLGCICALTPLT